jgi:hypothetical protein
MSILNPKDDIAAAQPLVQGFQDSIKGDVQTFLDGITQILETHKITIVIERK